MVPCVNSSTSKRKLAGIVITYNNNNNNNNKNDDLYSAVTWRKAITYRFNKFVIVTPCTRIVS